VDDPSMPLEGTSWLLAPSTPLEVDLGDVVVTAEFGGGRMTGSSGCNQYTATFVVDGSGFTIGPAIAGTKRFCDPARNDVEREFLQRLPLVRSYTTEGPALTLFDADGVPILAFAAVDPRVAIQRTWTVTNHYRGDAVTSVVGDVTLTAVFDAATVSGSTGVNQFHGPYEVDGHDIAIGALTVTLMAALDPELAEQERHFLRALDLSRSFRVTGDQLRLQRDGGTIAVTFSAA
jgi:heat shock protein HslJ